MAITHLEAVLTQLRIAESLGEMPAKAMSHIADAIERIERKIVSIEKAGVRDA